MLTIVLTMCFLGQAAAAEKAPAPVLTPLQQEVVDRQTKVLAIQKTLREVPMSPKDRGRLKKSLTRAGVLLRETREALVRDEAQKAEDAYVAKMMPIWREEARFNAAFSVEVAKANALQQMAFTAEARRRQQLWLDWQRNQILADEANSLRRMSTGRGF